MKNAADLLRIKYGIPGLEMPEFLTLPSSVQKYISGNNEFFIDPYSLYKVNFLGGPKDRAMRSEEHRYTSNSR